MKPSDKMISEQEYLYGMKGSRADDDKIIDVASKKDFPTLIGGGPAGNTLWAEGPAQSKPGMKSFGKKNAPQLAKVSDSDWGAGKNPFGGKPAGASSDQLYIAEEVLGKKPKKMKVGNDVFPTLPGQPIVVP